MSVSVVRPLARPLRWRLAATTALHTLAGCTPARCVRPVPHWKIPPLLERGVRRRRSVPVALALLPAALIGATTTTSHPTHHPTLPHGITPISTFAAVLYDRPPTQKQIAFSIPCSKKREEKGREEQKEKKEKQHKNGESEHGSECSTGGPPLSALYTENQPTMTRSLLLGSFTRFYLGESLVVPSRRSPLSGPLSSAFMIPTR